MRNLVVDDGTIVAASQRTRCEIFSLRCDFPADAYGLGWSSCRKLYLRTDTREERTRL